MKKVLMPLILFPLVLVQSACGARNPAPPVEEIPAINVTCPDPAGRARLTDGSTYRDLAHSRSESLRGWRLCYDALAIAQAR